MAYGNLNCHAGVGGSLTSIAADLETLWGTAIEIFLDIPVRDLNYYRAVLLIPDIFNRNHVKLLIDVLLNQLKFSCVIVNQVCIFTSGLLHNSVPPCLVTRFYHGAILSICYQKFTVFAGSSERFPLLPKSKNPFHIQFSHIYDTLKWSFYCITPGFFISILRLRGSKN